MTEKDRHVASVSAALSLLSAFDTAEALKLVELHQRTGLQRSRILRCLGTLEAAGFVTFNSANGTYELGPEAVRLGFIARKPFEALIQRMRGVIRTLSNETGATAFFSVIQGDARITIVAEEPESGVRYVIKEGLVRPLHIGATGKVLLAFCDADLRERILSGTLQQVTAKSITDPEILRSHVEQARSEGYSQSFGEATGSGVVMSAPLLDRNGGLLGAVSLAGPSEVIRKRETQMREALLAAVRARGQQMGGVLVA